MSAPTLFISDLHLPPGPSPLREAFIRFLRGPAREAGTLYILGDLFEYWVGDDVGLPVYAAEVAELSALATSGVRCGYMHGNRDFMIGKSFAHFTGCALLRDPLRVDIAGAPTLLSHGDLYCTDDLAYQRWRRFSRNPLAQWIYLRLSRARRERIAGGLRTGSQHKRPEIMDVNESAIAAAFANYAVKRIIHGHTHRPATHRYSLAGEACERIVLADWLPGRIEYLRVDGGRIERLAFT